MMKISEQEKFLINICLEAFACGATVEMATAALVCHENVQLQSAMNLAQYAERVWRAKLHWYAMRGMALPALPKESVKEILQKIPSIGLNVQTTGARFEEPPPPPPPPPADAVAQPEPANDSSTEAAQ